MDFVTVRTRGILGGRAERLLMVGETTFSLHDEAIDRQTEERALSDILSCAQDGATLWLIVLITSLSSPLMVVLTLRFLRGPEGELQLATPPSRPLLATDGGSPPAPHLDRRAQVAAVGAGAPSDDVRVRGFTPSKKPSNAKPASWSGRSHEAPM